jgi:two-component system, cell cycle response regulator DivK
MARVLVVDDYADARELYGEYLRFAEYEVETAADGVAALRCALKQACDAIVLDLALPEYDGLTILKLLRSNDKTKTVPVIVLSASVGSDVRDQAFAAGAVAFLPKPCTPDDLEKELRRVITASAATT